jgi:hypothetical protein
MDASRRAAVLEAELQALRDAIAVHMREETVLVFDNSEDWDSDQQAIDVFVAEAIKLEPYRQYAP